MADSVRSDHARNKHIDGIVNQVIETKISKLKWSQTQEGKLISIK